MGSLITTAILAVVIVSISSFLPPSLVDTSFVDTAFIASRGGWMYCDDSSVRPVDAKQVVVSNVVSFHHLLLH